MHGSTQSINFFLAACLISHRQERCSIAIAYVFSRVSSHFFSTMCDCRFLDTIMYRDRTYFSDNLESDLIRALWHWLYSSTGTSTRVYEYRTGFSGTACGTRHACRCRAAEGRKRGAPCRRSLWLPSQRQSLPPSRTQHWAWCWYPGCDPASWPLRASTSSRLRIAKMEKQDR